MFFGRFVNFWQIHFFIFYSNFIYFFYYIIHCKKKFFNIYIFHPIICKNIKIKMNEEPHFNITIKNLEELDISQNLIKKIGGIRKISDHFQKNKLLVI